MIRTDRIFRLCYSDYVIMGDRDGLEAHIIENSGHMCELSEEQNQRITDFIAEQ